MGDASGGFGAIPNAQLSFAPADPLRDGVVRDVDTSGNVGRPARTESLDKLAGKIEEAEATGAMAEGVHRRNSVFYPAVPPSSGALPVSYAHPGSPTHAARSRTTSVASDGTLDSPVLHRASNGAALSPPAASSNGQAAGSAEPVSSTAPDATPSPARAMEGVTLGSPARRERDTTSKVLIVYAGGTIGMADTPDGLECVPGIISKHMAQHRGMQDPELPPGNMPLSEHGLRISYDLVEYDPVLDSSNMDADDWARIARTIRDNYVSYDGFVILHGTDTMAYTTSALSFMLLHLSKTVVVTGAQIPITRIRNDAEGNLLGALTIAGHYDIPEVCLYFNGKLMRGSRACKVNAISMDAFDTPHLSPLAEVGIRVQVHWHRILQQPVQRFQIDTRFDRDVALFYLYPGVQSNQLRRALQPPTRGLILMSFGSGNAPNDSPGFLEALREATQRGVIVLNISQCTKGRVVADYATGVALARVGVVSGSDMTTEAALAKLGCLLGRGLGGDELREALMRPLAGELTRGPSKRLTSDSVPFVSAVYRAMEVAGEVTGDQPRSDMHRIRDALAPTLMCSAAASGNVGALAAMVKAGADINQVEYDGRTPLHLAAAEGHSSVVEYLLSQGAQLHTEDRWGQTPLAEATRWRHQDVVEMLEGHGASTAASEAIRKLAQAAYNEDLVAMRRLLRNGADPNSILYDGRTALHLAASNGNAKAVELLCAYGASTNFIDAKKRSPLSLAVRYGHDAAATMLRRFGALLRPLADGGAQVKARNLLLLGMATPRTPLQRFRFAVRRVIMMNRLAPLQPGSAALTPRSSALPLRPPPPVDVTPPLAPVAEGAAPPAVPAHLSPPQ